MPITKHGHARRGKHSRAHTAWQSMIRRCIYPKAHGYSRYGGRGITVCERWRTFENFLADMGNPPDGMSLDRINNDGNYEPSNCRWATRKEQTRNSSTVRKITFNGETHITSDWELKLGIAKGGIWRRMKAGWSLEKALSTVNSWTRRS